MEEVEIEKVKLDKLDGTAVYLENDIDILARQENGVLIAGKNGHQFIF